MEFPKPPPLKEKPVCPAVATKWFGVHPKHVRLTIMVSVAFWTCVIALPVCIIAYFVWPELHGLGLAKLAGIVVIVGAFYLSYGFGMVAANRILKHGMIHSAIRHHAKKRGHI